MIPDEAIFLIGIIPSRKDLDIVRLFGWYRIPLRSAPKVIDVDYLAFYQPGSFGKEDRWQISCYAKVVGHELTTRKDLIRDEPDHPRSKEEYFKIQVGPLEYLDYPIKAASWKRLTFLFSTGKLMNSARDVKGLVVRDDERKILWRALRERASRSESYQTRSIPGEEEDADIMEMLKIFIDFPSNGE